MTSSSTPARRSMRRRPPQCWSRGADSVAGCAHSGRANCPESPADHGRYASAGRPGLDCPRQCHPGHRRSGPRGISFPGRGLAGAAHPARTCSDPDRTSASTSRAAGERPSSQRIRPHSDRCSAGPRIRHRRLHQRIPPPGGLRPEPRLSALRGSSPGNPARRAREERGVDHGGGHRMASAGKAPLVRVDSLRRPARPVHSATCLSAPGGTAATTTAKSLTPTGRDAVVGSSPSVRRGSGGSCEQGRGAAPVP